MPGDRFRRRSNGDPIEIDLSTTIGVGGEAKVHPVGERLVAKLYHEPSAKRTAKLAAMVAEPPRIPVGVHGHVMIAWPLDLIEDADTGEVVGYVMDRVAEARHLIDFYNPKIRQRVAKGFNTGYLMRTARNLAVSVDAVHEMGYVIGDLNESNILTRDTALITLIDLDSIQVRDRQTGRVDRCEVGKVEYTPPEGQGKGFDTYDRDPSHDRFALGVLVFQLLMEGTHPFAGTPAEKGENVPITERIQDGVYPYHRFKDTGYEPRQMSPELAALHPKLQELFGRCFEDGHDDPKRRPTAAEWIAALATAEDDLRTCGRNHNHRYASHNDACPWCARAEALGGYDSFPPRGDTREVPKLDESVSRRNLRERRAEREQRRSKLALAALPAAILILGAILFHLSGEGAASASERSAAKGGSGTSGESERAAKPSGAANPRTEPKTAPSATAKTPPEKRAPSAVPSAKKSPDTDPSEKGPPARLETETERPAEDLSPPFVPRVPRDGQIGVPVDANRRQLIAKVRPRRAEPGVTRYALRGRIANAVLHDVAATSDAVWVATDHGLLRFDPQADQWQLCDNPSLGPCPYGAIAGYKRELVGDFRDDPRGTLILDFENMRWRQLGGPAKSLVVADSILWAGTVHGLHRVDIGGGRPQRFHRQAGTLPHDTVSALSMADDRLWIGHGAGVSRMNTSSNHVKHYAAKDGLAHAEVVDLAIGIRSIWAVHGKPGISRFDRRSQRWKPLRGRAVAGLAAQAVAFENRNNVWFGGVGERGLFRGTERGGQVQKVLALGGRSVVALATAHGAVWALFSPVRTGAGTSVIVRLQGNRIPRRADDVAATRKPGKRPGRKPGKRTGKKRRAKSPAELRAERRRIDREVYNRLATRERSALDATTQAAVDRGVRWLIGHQNGDGRFDADGFMKRDRSGKRCDGPGNPASDVGVTAVAMLALLPGASSTEAAATPRRRAIERAAQWLIRQQGGRGGGFGGPNGRIGAHGDALATNALCRTYAAYGNSNVLAAAERAIAALQERQVSGAGWRYDTLAEDSDTMMTAWSIEALTVGADLGLDVDAERLAEALSWLDAATDDATGRTGYTGVGVPAYRPAGFAKSAPARRSHANTAAALHARFLLGHRLHNSTVVCSGAMWLGQIVPVWQPGRVDLIEWYFGSHALWGIYGDEAQQRRFRRVLIAAQCGEGNAAGSWDPIGLWGRDGGRVYSTATALLVLQAAARVGRRNSATALSDHPKLQPVKRIGAATFPTLSKSSASLPENVESPDDRALVRRLQLEVKVAASASDLLLGDIETIDNWPGRAMRLARILGDYDGMPAGDAAKASIAGLPKDGDLAAELAAMKQLAEVQRRYAAQPKLLAREVERFVAEHLHTRCAARWIDWLMANNVSVGRKVVPDARALPLPKAKKATVGGVLSSRPDRFASLKLPARWWRVPDKTHHRFVMADGKNAGRMHLRVHRGQDQRKIKGAVEGQIRRERAAQQPYSAKDVDVRFGGQRVKARQWSYRTKQTPAANMVVVLVPVRGGMVELGYAHVRGASDRQKILRSLQVRNKVSPVRAFQIRAAGWEWQGALPNLVCADAPGGDGKVVWIDRPQRPNSRFELRVSRSPARDLSTAIRAHHDGIASDVEWQGKVYASGKQIRWLVYTARHAEGYYATAFARIDGEIDVVWTYSGKDNGERALRKILGSMKGQPILTSGR